MRIHFIAIGGAVMHNLAIALKMKGYQVTGSDDEIFDPSLSRLKAHDLLPEKWGWDPEKISGDLDAVILGMHARQDNPELKKALDLGLRIYSFPEYLFEQTRHKKRVVIAGSHGKTTITSMVMHVLKDQHLPFDYMVGSQIRGFDTMVGLSEEAKIAVFEGDEYLSSPLDPRPKFIHYKPHLTLITGIAWDHMNVFPVYEEYKQQFAELCKRTNPEGEIIYFGEDKELEEVIHQYKGKANITSYKAIPYKTLAEGTSISNEGKDYKTRLIGKYNMENLGGAMKICERLGVSAHNFLRSIQSFEGAAKRQELLFKSDGLSIYQDFAHAPSKVKATVDGFRESFPGKKLITLLELHTFSSLNKDFLPLYEGTLENSDEAYVFFHPEVVKHKKLPELNVNFVYQCFGKDKLNVLTDPDFLKTTLENKLKGKNMVVLVMSSGNLGGIDPKKLAPVPS